MTSDHSEFAEYLSFSRRYGYEPLPEPMRLEEISDDLRREIWNEFRSLLMREQGVALGYPVFNAETRRYIERIFGRFTRQPESKISTLYKEVLRNFEQIIATTKFNRILDLLEIMIEEHEQPDAFAKHIIKLFERNTAAYWLDISRKPYRFIPGSSKEQKEATCQALETLRINNMDGEATHLRQAVEHINARQYADAISDCIHAVESVARIVDPKSSTTLGPALYSLEKSGFLNHPALKQAFEKLYGYTNTEEGIRHALVFKDSANVGLDEALFMFGACASFAAYLTQKHRQIGSV